MESPTIPASLEFCPSDRPEQPSQIRHKVPLQISQIWNVRALAKSADFHHLGEFELFFLAEKLAQPNEDVLAKTR